MFTVHRSLFTDRWVRSLFAPTLRRSTLSLSGAYTTSLSVVFYSDLSLTLGARNGNGCFDRPCSSRQLSDCWTARLSYWMRIRTRTDGEEAPHLLIWNPLHSIGLFNKIEFLCDILFATCQCCGGFEFQKKVFSPPYFLVKFLTKPSSTICVERRIMNVWYYFNLNTFLRIYEYVMWWKYY